MVLVLIAVLLAGYGLYHGLTGLAMLGGPGTPVLMLAFLLQGILALVAAFGVWRGLSWAPSVLLLLGVVIAATALVEAFVLGIIGWLWALLIAVVAIVVALLIGAYVRRSAVAA